MVSQTGINSFDSSFWYTPNAADNATKPQIQNPNLTSLPQDTVEIAGKKSTAKKILIGAGIAATIGGIIYCVATGKFSRAKQLAEHIDFKPAKTLEEAINFGKTNFGIKSYEGFTEKDLEILNFTNEGLANIHSKFKGKIQIARKIIYEPVVNSNEVASTIGNYCLSLNKNYFCKINNHIQEKIKDINSIIFCFNEKDREYITKIIKEYEAGKCTTLEQKLNTENILGHAIDKVNYYANPNNALKFVSDNGILTYKGKPFSYTEALKWSPEMKEEFVHAFWKSIKNNPKIKISLDKSEIESAFGFLYHEIGHTNDPHLAHRTKEFLKNPDAVNIAAKVSGYAKTNEDEFIAEVFKKLASGKKLPEDVMKLYKELGGPMVP